MLFRWFSKIKKKNNFNYTNGFTIVEVMVSMIISLSVFWGIMTLYLDVAKNQIEDQIVEAAKFNLTTIMDKIVKDIRGADSIYISQNSLSGFDNIKIMAIDNITGAVSDEHTYSSFNDEGNFNE